MLTTGTLIRVWTISVTGMQSGFKHILRSPFNLQNCVNLIDLLHLFDRTNMGRHRILQSANVTSPMPKVHPSTTRYI